MNMATSSISFGHRIMAALHLRPKAPKAGAVPVLKTFIPLNSINNRTRDVSRDPTPTQPLRTAAPQARGPLLTKLSQPGGWLHRQWVPGNVTRQIASWEQRAAPQPGSAAPPVRAPTTPTQAKGPAPQPPVRVTPTAQAVPVAPTAPPQPPPMPMPAATSVPAAPRMPADVEPAQATAPPAPPLPSAKEETRPLVRAASLPEADRSALFAELRGNPLVKKLQRSESEPRVPSVAAAPKPDTGETEAKGPESSAKQLHGIQIEETPLLLQLKGALALRGAAPAEPKLSKDKLHPVDKSPAQLPAQAPHGYTGQRSRSESDENFIAELMRNFATKGMKQSTPK